MTRGYGPALSRRQRAWTMVAVAGMILLALAMTAVALAEVGGGVGTSAAGPLDRAQAVSAALGERTPTPAPTEAAVEDEAPRGGPFRVNLNIADQSQLEQVPGLGKVKAKAILAYRAEHRFVVASDLMKVKGFGPATFEKLKGCLVVDGPAIVGTPSRGSAPGGRARPAGAKHAGKALDADRARRR